MKKITLTRLALLAVSACAISAHAQSNDVTLPSGAIVQIENPGSGAHPTPADRVTVNYVGTLDNGTVFDASARHGGPASFNLGQVIPCWTQGVAQLGVGGKAKLTCPPQTAYGNHAMGNLIPANSTLTFEVELLGINQ